MLNKNIEFNKNEKKSKMENSTHSFREMNYVLQLLQELRAKSKAVMSWSSRKKTEGIFCNVYFVRSKFFQYLYFISMYSVMNELSEYIYFYVSGNITSHTFVACF